MTPPCKKCDHHVSTNADGLCGKCAPAPHLTRTEAIKAYCEGKAVTFDREPGGWLFPVVAGERVDDAGWCDRLDRDRDSATDAVQGEIIARIDAALANATPAQRPEVGSVHPWDVARADMEAHPEARWQMYSAMAKMQDGYLWIRDGAGVWWQQKSWPTSQQTFSRLPDEPITPAQAVEAATTVFDSEPLKAATDRFAREMAAIRAECDHLRRSQSLALDHVVRLRGVSARLVEALDLMTELLKEAP